MGRFIISPKGLTDTCRVLICLHQFVMRSVETSSTAVRMASSIWCWVLGLTMPTVYLRCLTNLELFGLSKGWLRDGQYPVNIFRNLCEQFLVKTSWLALAPQW